MFPGGSEYDLAPQAGRRRKKDVLDSSEMNYKEQEGSIGL